MASDRQPAVGIAIGSISYNRQEDVITSAA